MSRIKVQSQAQKADRTQVRAAIGIDGLSGDGKTGLALTLAYYLGDKDWEKVYMNDTENQSSKLYVGKKLHTGDIVGKFWYNYLNNDSGYSPFNYEFLRNEAIELKCKSYIQDSYSHAWFREGGVLDTKSKVETGADRRYNDSYRAWGHPDVADGKNLLFDLIRSDKIHMISTIRIKESYVLEADENGKTKVKSLGEKQITSEGLTYEFDLLMRLVEPGNSNGKAPIVEILKSRYELFNKGERYEMTKNTILKLKEYLEQGTSIEELNERTRLELAESIKERASNNKNLMMIYKNNQPEKKVSELTLEELKAINSMFIEVEYE